MPNIRISTEALLVSFVRRGRRAVAGDHNKANQSQEPCSRRKVKHIHDVSPPRGAGESAVKRGLSCSAIRRKTGAASKPPKLRPSGSSRITTMVKRGRSAGKNPQNETNAKV